MSEDEQTPAEQIEAPLGPGERLRAAREASGLELAQVAADTRIPLRHLEAIEAGNFAALPARTYAIGFSKSFAKAVGLDEEEIGEEVRAELSTYEPEPVTRAASFEPGDPARVPGGSVIWIAAAAVLVLLVVAWFGYNSLFAPAAELPSLVQEQPARKAAQAPAKQQAAQAPASSGPVVFTALADGVWVKFYDADGNQLMQKQMALGERYVVPPDANGPQLWTGRPDALSITIGGRPVPKLAADDQIMKDVPVSAAALLARGTNAVPSGAPTALPSPPQPVPAAPRRTAAPEPAPASPPPSATD